jgi:hypothetical protein
VIGELSEELGTLRNKVAMGLNNTVFATPVDEQQRRCFGALTSDIGLHVLIARPASQVNQGQAKTEAQVRCTICNLDTDRVPTERFHTPHQIHEVCVKGENEGIFYNCKEHNPATQQDPVFLEQLERFDIFGR